MVSRKRRLLMISPNTSHKSVSSPMCLRRKKLRMSLGEDEALVLLEMVVMWLWALLVLMLLGRHRGRHLECLVTGSVSVCWGRHPECRESKASGR